jgi:replicative DNA helicase
MTVAEILKAVSPLRTAVSQVGGGFAAGGEADLILGKHRNGPTKTITVAHQLHLSRFTNIAKP